MKQGYVDFYTPAKKGSSESRECLTPPVKHSQGHKHRYVFILILTTALLTLLYPVLARTPSAGTPGLHASMAVVSSLLALITGWAAVLYYPSTGNRFFLFIGLAFLAGGASDFVQGILTFGNIQGVLGMSSTKLKNFIPGAYVMGRLLFAALLLAAPFARTRRAVDEAHEAGAFRLASAALLIPVILTAAAAVFSLPRVIFPDFFISRPLDLLTAVMMTTALVIFLREYRDSRDMLAWWFSLSIGVAAAGQFMMLSSGVLFDQFFHTAVFYQTLSCMIPLVGFSLHRTSLVSERTMLQEELKKQRQHLEEIVTQRTAGLTEANETLQKEIDELRQMEKKIHFEMSQRKQAEDQMRVLMEDVERTNKELEEFAYVVSHDLKAPLRGITSLARWLYEDYMETLDEEGRQTLDKLMIRTKRMHNLIEGILRYSRIGRFKITRQLLDSNMVAQEVIEGLAAPETISVKIDGPLPAIFYDRMLLIQLFQNLIGNAITHLGKPEGEVVVSCMEQADAWQFCVKDNGVGIEERHFERIFKIFQSLKPRSEKEATGIGLSLVKKITERNGGSVWVESTVGKGSDFYFTVPKSPETEETVTGLTVLIIDDNREFIEVVAAMFEREKHKILIALNGQEAYETLEAYKQDIQIILMDIHIPGEDAVERFIKIKELHPDVKIIACTGAHLPEVIDQLKEKGLDGVLTKPFKTNDLNRIIGHVQRQEIKQEAN